MLVEHSSDVLLTTLDLRFGPVARFPTLPPPPHRDFIRKSMGGGFNLRVELTIRCQNK